MFWQSVLYMAILGKTCFFVTGLVENDNPTDGSCKRNFLAPSKSQFYQRLINYCEMWYNEWKVDGYNAQYGIHPAYFTHQIS